MSDPMVVFAFVMILFTPCLIAFASWAGDDEQPDEVCLDNCRGLRPMGEVPGPLQAMLPEVSVAKDFEIRSFPKGLAQRRIVVRDAESGPRLTITQVREAAVELAKLGGFIVAHELALVAAALVAAGRSVAAAAREAIEAAQNAYAWMAWNGALDEGVAGPAWDVGPPKFAPVSATVSVLDNRWSRVSRAA
jgi:hypothetical protein